MSRKRCKGRVGAARARATALILLAGLDIQTGAEGSVGTNDEECKLYLAPYAEGEFPLSVYTAVDLPQGSPIGNPELGIPMIDVLRNNEIAHAQFLKQPLRESNGDEDEEMDESGLASDFVDLLWMPSEMGADFEDQSGEDGLAIIAGLGTAGVQNPGHVNAQWDRSPLFRRYRHTSLDNNNNHDTPTPSQIHAGLGAYSEYYDITLRATRDVRAGSEILPFFGEAWFDAKDEEATENTRLLTKTHYDRADQIMTDFIKLINAHPDFFTSEATLEFWNLVRTDVVQDQRTRSLLPLTPQQVQETVGSFGGSSIFRKHPKTRRSPAWLKENGFCLDTLKPGPSTIPEAGRGAFATRSIKKGDLVAPGPLLRLSRRQLQIFDHGEEKDSQDEDSAEKQQQQQLLLNYCFAHPNSSILLFPHSSNVNFINHHKQKANVKVIWTTNTLTDADFLLEMTPVEFDEEEDFPSLGLMFDYIATQDIQPGDEVFLDYGSEWEDAWKEHVALWVSEGEEDENLASVLNVQEEFFRTVKEQEEEPYPESVYTICFYRQWNEEDDIPLAGSAVLQELVPEEGNVHLWTQDGEDSVEALCEILHREPLPCTDTKDEDDANASCISSYVYLAQLLKDNRKETTNYIQHVPQDAIMFVNSPYTSAMHRRDAFRHPIGFPEEEDVFPKAWYDLDGDEI